MTPEEALDHSSACVARLMVDGGALAIARGASGFQVSFVPKTEEGIWNLAGTLLLDSCSTLEQAVQRACEGRECVYDAWEPAPENIIGFEPAQSLAPVVDGHHLRFHGHRAAVPGLPVFPLELTPAACLLLGAAMMGICFAVRKLEEDGRLK